MRDLEALKSAVIAGKRMEAMDLTKQAIDEGVDPNFLIDHHLIPALDVVGKKFQEKEIFVPEMMIAAKSMQACLDLVKPLIKKEGGVNRGTLVIGTVFGDLHDIGKNLVRLLLEGSGFRVIDLGVGVPSEKFLGAAKENDADVVGLSSLLTTGDPYVLETVKAIKASDLSTKIKVICGGAALTPRFVMETCGADAYAKDAAEGVKKTRELLRVP